MIGSAFFNSGDGGDEDEAVEQGQKVGADLVLVLSPKYTGTVTTSIPITTPTTTTSQTTGHATAFGAGGPVSVFGSATTTTYGSETTYVPMTVHRSDYGALYFVKRRFTFGALWRDLNDQERQSLQTNKGIAIRVIVDGSPAFDADLLPGDLVTAVDGEPVVNSAGLTKTLEEKAGQALTLSVVRQGQPLKKTVQLAPP